MWKLRVCIGLALLAIISVGSGCQSVPPDIEAGLGEEFFLYLGQTAWISGENLAIKFEEMVEDSRCPKGVVCVWTGRVTCTVEIMQAGSSYQMALTQPGLTEEYSKERYQGYELAFYVTPYPEAGKEIRRQDYRLHLMVTKVPELTKVLRSVLADPRAFEGQEITVMGYYRGWDLLQEANVSPPVTRSDWVLKDDSGAIYVSAKSEAGVPEGLHPTSLEDTEVVLEVKGIVRLTDAGQPYIEATSIKRVL